MKQAQSTLSITAPRRGFHEITAEIAGWTAGQGIATGLLTVFCRHTSASLTIQENADPDVLRDLESFLDRLAPEEPARYRHTAEGPDDMPAHIKGVLTDTALTIPVAEARPLLGTWQGIYLIEHRDRPSARRIVLHLMGE
ncbi:MAG: secondary thiamine-phosphate synthase enzyme YjbQ [Rhodospirillales bacterium]